MLKRIFYFVILVFCLSSSIFVINFFTGCGGGTPPHIYIVVGKPTLSGSVSFTLKCCGKAGQHEASEESFVVNTILGSDNANQKATKIADWVNTHSDHFRLTATTNNITFNCIPYPQATRWVLNVKDNTKEPNIFVFNPTVPIDQNQLSFINTNDIYAYATFSCSNNATGISYDGVNPGKIQIGTSSFVAEVNTTSGQSPRQILDIAKSQLVANGYQDVSVNTPDNVTFNLSFKLDFLRDSSIYSLFDDSGAEMTFNGGCSCLECNEKCIIIGPEHIPVHSTGAIYKEDSLRGGWWNLMNYTAHASIEWQNDSIVSVSAGNVGGYFKLCYEVLILPDSIYETCCKFIYVDDPTPIELINFNSVTTRSDLTLNWTTATEENNSGFEVIRSTRDESWTTAGFVKGAGNSSEPISYTFKDRNLNSGIYQYRLKQIDFNGNFKYYDLINEVVIGVPDKYSLHQNYPNPFNPVTKIRYDIPNSGNVSLKIYDNIGREAKTLVIEFKDAGYYTVEFNGSNFASGIYYYKLETGNFVATKKMVLLK